MTESHPAERVRQQLERFMEMSGQTQREFAAALGKSQPWLEKILKGENHVRLEDLDDLAGKMHTTASQLLRADDDRYTLELTPSEFSVIERLRRKPELLDACLTLLQAAPASSVGSRRASPAGLAHGSDHQVAAVASSDLVAALTDTRRAIDSLLAAHPGGSPPPTRAAVAGPRPSHRPTRRSTAPKDRPA